MAASYGPTEAVELAITAGADMAMAVATAAPSAYLDRLEEAVAAGRLPPGSRVGEAVERVLDASDTPSRLDRLLTGEPSP